jgi:hypothetical protein
MKIISFGDKHIRNFNVTLIHSLYIFMFVIALDRTCQSAVSDEEKSYCPVYTFLTIQLLPSKILLL